MGTVIDLERTIFFMFHFFLKVDPTILSSGRLTLIKSLINTNETNFRLQEIFFRNRLLLCATIATMSCRNNLSWLTLSQRCGTVKNESCGDVGLRRCDNLGERRCQDVAITLL